MSQERMVWRLQKRPVGTIAEDDLSYGKEAMPALEDGQFRLQILYLSLDPTNRIWMSDQEQYMPPVALGAPMRGGVCGRVVESRKAGVTEGDIFAGIGEWADQIITDGRMLAPMRVPKGVPLSVGFGVFGLVGPTAYFGLLDIGKPKAGETLVVSAASGGVGQIVGQIGKIKGCRVIGIAGGPEKCRYIVDELGFDAAIDYKNEDLLERLKVLAPDGVDINFEQVGGTIMEAVMTRMNIFGRMPLCGLVSSYNDTKNRGGPRTFPLIIMRRLTVQGFIVTDYMPRFGEMAKELGQWMLEGRIKTRQDVRKGLDHAVTYLNSLYSGENFGKLLVEVTPDAAGALTMTTAQAASIWFGNQPSELFAMKVAGIVPHIGIELLEFGPDYLRGRMPVDERTRQPFGLLHGGASVVLAETLASLAAAAVVDLKTKRCVGLEINANHLRGVSSGWVIGTARPIHLGRATHVWDIRICDEADKPVCISRCTMAILDAPAAKA